MCNRYVQKGREVRPGQKTTVLMRGPGGYFEMPFDEAVFGGPARTESRNYWIRREGAEEVIVPGIERFGEKDKRTGRQNWASVPPESAMEGLLLPSPPGKDYRLLKIVTQPATQEQSDRLGNDRVPVLLGVSAGAITLPPAIDAPAKPEEKEDGQQQQLELLE
ncbi:MAG: hypothetical protein WCF18_05140 [Chthoniobacteraceae bacterium]